MAKLINMTGQVFGYLTVLDRAEENCGTRAQWRCRCKCGTETVVTGKDLRNGHVKSCGCYKIDLATARLTVHGHSPKAGSSRTYDAYMHMIGRTCNSNDKSFRHYGGRGIKVCRRWKRSFVAFLSDMGECPPGLTLGRVDNDGDYTPKNCRWETRLEQGRNTRRNVLLTHEGVTMTLVEWAQKVGIGYETLRWRLGPLGWSVKDALTTPVRGWGPGRKRSAN